MNRFPRTSPLYLGIECGGTRTVALLGQFEGAPATRWEGTAANLRLLDDAGLVAHFQHVARALPRPHAIAIGMAGARTELDRQRIRRAAAEVWPGIPCHATNDLETALLAADDSRSPSGSGARSDARAGKRKLAFSNSNDAPPIHRRPRVLVLSGTGSCCFGVRADGRTAKIGGWGHLLGDKGSAFEIGLRALKAVVYYLDRDGDWSALGQRLLRALQLNEPDELISWTQDASKAEIAGLAIEVFKAWAKGDHVARDILRGAAGTLASDAVSCARCLVAPGTPVEFIFAGGVLLKQPRFARDVADRICASWCNASIRALRHESVSGALTLARTRFPPAALIASTSAAGGQRLRERREAANDAALIRVNARSMALSPTEQRNPRSMNLDKLSLTKAIRLMLDEDRKIPSALWAERKRIEAGVRLIVKALGGGGRLFYLGAGTSGRLGILDASECPPTFHTDPAMVQGIIAGGHAALWASVEGAEDDAEAGARAIEFRGVTARDVVIGIAASGRTPFVWGALREAKRRHSATILLCFNPSLAVARADRPSLIIAPNVGPEVLTGSTRLKAGTATKLVLNIFTTLSMVCLGKVSSNLMIDLKPSNTKLRDRAARIVQELTGVDYGSARDALDRTDWKIRAACTRLRHGRT
jgi:N-acetylmuramic acid 6-phosphate etherase